MKEAALYIHIPFCDHKCIYCDFYSIITTENLAKYLDALKKEISYYSKLYSGKRFFTSVFFGGGTPSLVMPDYLSEIITSLKNNFNVSANAEITMETNPGTVDKKKLMDFLNAGINRISIGIQSFDENELKFLTRIHNKQTAINTVNDAKEVGFNNISIDLIFNLPGQTKDVWQKNLQTAFSLPINHISAYSLILERGTILNKLVLDGKVSMQDDDFDADLYELAIDYITSKGFIQYEVSSFALPGYECRHNNSYWKYNDYISFGTSAHSFVDNKRWWNFSSLKKYISEVETSGNAQANFELLNGDQRLEEFVMLALRSTGLNITELKNNFGEHWINKNFNYFEKLINQKYMQLSNDRLSLTKKGYPLCDEIIRKLF